VLIITGVTIDRNITKQKEQAAEQRVEEATKDTESAEKAKRDAEADRDAKAAESAEKQRQIDELQKQLQAKRDAEARLASQASPAPSRSSSVIGSVTPTVNAVGCHLYEGLIGQYEWNAPTMLRIMNAESSCDPSKMNYGDNHGSCLGSYGLMQIGCIHGVTDVQMADPAANIAQAYSIWRSQGYGAWSTY
jgi:hypothetical protein